MSENKFTRFSFDSIMSRVGVFNKRLFAHNLEAYMKARMLSEQGYGHQRVPSLSPAYARRKMKLVGSARSDGVFSGRLFNSISVEPLGFLSSWKKDFVDTGILQRGVSFGLRASGKVNGSKKFTNKDLLEVLNGGRKAGTYSRQIKVDGKPDTKQVKYGAIAPRRFAEFSANELRDITNDTLKGIEYRMPQISILNI